MATIPYPFVVCAVDPLDYLRHALTFHSNEIVFKQKEQESISLRVFRNFPYKICPTADGSRTKPRGNWYGGCYDRAFHPSGHPPVSSGGLPES